MKATTATLAACSLTLLLLATLPRAGAELRTVDLSDQLIFTDVADDVRSATVQPNGFVAPMPAADAPPEEPPPIPAAEEPLKHDTPRGSLRATLRRLGAPAPADDDDDDALRSAVTQALRAAKMPLLRGLLFERGGSCAGCNERAEFVQAVLDSLSRPLVARHALPLFLYDAPLLPHTTTPLHLFEPRYKLLCRKALKSERLFGFVTGAHGTLARITTWRFTDDDAADGSCHITVTGLRRFRMGRQWQDRCVGCSSGPLHMADVVYFNDTAVPEARTARGVGLVKESLRLHHALVDASAQRDVEARIGAPPTVRDRGYAMSFWLAAACAALDERCQAHATKILASTSVAERLEAVVKVQKALAGQKFTSRRG